MKKIPFLIGFSIIVVGAILFPIYQLAGASILYQQKDILLYVGASLVIIGAVVAAIGGLYPVRIFKKREIPMIEVTDERHLSKQLKANSRVVALFYSSWCPFCRSFLTVFNKQIGKLGSVVFMRVKVDEDENPLWETLQD